MGTDANDSSAKSGCVIIAVALIGVFGTVTAAALANWDKIFGTRATTDQHQVNAATRPQDSPAAAKHVASPSTPDSIVPNPSAGAAPIDHPGNSFAGAESKPSPAMPSPAKELQQDPMPDPERKKHALEKYPLDSLDYVGSIGKGSGLIALVQAPDKLTYRLRPGDYMGQDHGRIQRVHEDHIEIEELTQDINGKWTTRSSNIAISEY